MRSTWIALMLASQVAWAAWPRATAALFAGSGATCEVKVTCPGGSKPVWEGRVLAKEARIRVANRRACASPPPGPEELIWTGQGAVRLMGGRPSEFLPGARLTVLEAYLMLDLLVPLWSPGQPTGKALPVEGVFGKGQLWLRADGKADSLLVTLNRPLWDGSTLARAVFASSGESGPWRQATLYGASPNALATFERLRFRRAKLDDDVFSVKTEGGLRLADLSKPLGQLTGTTEGGYAETAGSSAAFKSAVVVAAGTGSVYLGPVPTPDEVDRFLQEGKLGRYADGE